MPSLKYLFIPWAVLFLFYLLVCILAFYPGNIPIDGLNQLIQINTGQYSNHHSIFHTQIINFLWTIGNLIFHNANASVFIYFVFQILIFTFSLAYLIFTLVQFNVKKAVIIVLFVFYLLMPIFILYSFILYKDILFTASIIIFSVAIFRKLKIEATYKKLNIAILIISSFCICLLRNNGIFVYLFFLIIFCIIYFKTKLLRKFILCGLGILLCSVTSIIVVTTVCNVKPADVVETLSIPLQQVANVAQDTDNLSLSQVELIDDVCDIKAVKNKFQKNNADGIKNSIRDKGNQNVLLEKAPQYLLLYFQLGFTYPNKYIEEWIEMTKGYYNSGYSERLFDSGIIVNKFGLEQQIVLKDFNNLILYSINFLQDWFPLCLSIGVYTWILFAALFLAICKKDKSVIAGCIPSLGVFLTLLLSTPLYCEFRYAFPIICMAPFLLIIAYTSQTSCDKISVN